MDAFSYLSVLLSIILGLAIAHAYARAHSGDLRYERGQPAGARFVVELPSELLPLI